MRSASSFIYRRKLGKSLEEEKKIHRLSGQGKLKSTCSLRWRPASCASLSGSVSLLEVKVRDRKVGGVWFANRKWKSRLQSTLCSVFLSLIAIRSHCMGGNIDVLKGEGI
jgi:hypothetical protein